MIGKVINNRRLTTEIFMMSLSLPETFPTPAPGQFIMMRAGGFSDPLLGRPFSIYSFKRNKRKVTVEILYRVVGKGTLLFSTLKRGYSLDIIGPYGRTFEAPPNAGKVVLLSGGVGIAPITYLASYYKNLDEWKDVEFISYCGVSSAPDLVGKEELRQFCSDVLISTDDGSAGYHGFVTELFERDLSFHKTVNSKIYACGPRPMLKSLAKLLFGYPLSCQVLLEERMACGVGACLGCVVGFKDIGTTGRYKRVCTDGPVFNIDDIMWC